MANAATFTILITALDRSAATFRSIGARVAAMGAPFARIGKSVAELGEAAGITSLAHTAEHAGARFMELGHRVGEVLGPVAALGAAASAAGLFEMAKGAAEWSKQLSLGAEKTGEGVDALAKLHYAAEVNGVSVEGMDHALERLNRTIGATASGRNKQAAGLFAAMHISLRNANGSLKDAAQLLPELSTHFAANSSMAEKTNAAFLLIGRSGAELLPLLGRGGEELKKTGATFERFYGKITPAVIAAATKGAESFETLKLATSALKFTIGSALFPALEKIITPVTGWVAANRQLISTKVAEWATRIGNALSHVDWNRVWAAAKGFGQTVVWIGEKLGSFWGTLAVAGVAFSPLILATGKVGVALAQLGLKVAWFTLESLPGLFLSLATLTETALPGASAAFMAMGVAIEATPIGWILTGIAAVSAIGYELYQHWDWISKQWHDLWAGMGVDVNKLNAGLRTAAELALMALPGGQNLAMAMMAADAKAAADDAARGTMRARLGARSAEAMKYFLSQGWSKSQAAGIVGNLQYESGGLDPNKRQRGGPGYGLAQWTLGADRARNFEKFAHRPLVGSSFEQQLAFVQFELTKGAEHAAGEVLRRAATTAAATAVVQQRYERPSHPMASLAARTAIAQQLATASTTPVAAPSTSAPSGQAGLVNGTHVRVEFQNAPKGTKVSAKTSGPNPPRLDTGVAWAI